MDPTIEGSVIAAGAGLFATLLTFLFDLGRTKRRDKILGERVRTMLGAEVDYNLILLKQCMDYVREFKVEGLKSEPHQNSALEIARELSQFPPLIWSRRVLENSMALLPLALKSNEKLDMVLRTYAALDNLASIQAQVIKQQRDFETVTREIDQVKMVDSMDLMTPLVFERLKTNRGVLAMVLAGLGEKFLNEGKAVLDLGNSVREQESVQTKAKSL